MRRILKFLFYLLSIIRSSFSVAVPISDLEKIKVEEPRFNDALVGMFRNHLQDTYGHVAHILPGQCLNVAYNVIDQIVPIFMHYFPKETSVIPVIWIGNVIVANNEQPQWDDEQVREFAANPVVDPGMSAQYHAWISFDRLIVDLTLLYSLDGEQGLQKNRVLVSVNEVNTDYGNRVEFLPYNFFSKASLVRLMQR